MTYLRSLCWICLCGLLPLVAHAQWRWTDKDGRTIFSDTAPPADIPEKNIQQRGRQPAPQAVPPSVAGAPNGAAPAAPVGTPPAPGANTKSAADKELEEKVRKAEEAEKAQKEAEARKVAQAKAENCDRARQSKATYDSGIRIARVNSQGEREILDDAARAQELQRIQQVISTDCK
ncbi:DUF4124 domain-containing protein [Variovorax dokdonensis]|uniref:DUF4124 domain-containing protein n=1 Tax=Variovorax dokdonensis TaxID=344883 RepID=A0ABT7NH82_9BURK|nr:DUF4124 domain-containing protein [Variovorax dokdonensis]MDM0047260.1 DUF4124 domain-containing protein [Variovorax dokdonensis]